MAGTVSGGLSAAKTNKEKYGEDFYKKIGSKGGKKSRTGGFYANRELARIAGAKGGRISRRVPSCICGLCVTCKGREYQRKRRQRQLLEQAEDIAELKRSS